MPFGITGQSSRSNSSQVTVGDNSVAGNNSGNDNSTQDNRVYTAESGGISAGGDVSLVTTDAGLLDAASKIVESALGVVTRVVETGFGSANRSVDLVASAGAAAVDQVAAANGRPLAGSLQRYGVWLAAGALVLGLVWVLVKRGK